jgi:glyoxylate carboligase
MIRARETLAMRDIPPPVLIDIPSAETLAGFCDYVLDFYGPAGIYPMGATREQVEHAVAALLRIFNTRCVEFDDAAR